MPRVVVDLDLHIPSLADPAPNQPDAAFERSRIRTLQVGRWRLELPVAGGSREGQDIGGDQDIGGVNLIGFEEAGGIEGHFDEKRRPSGGRRRYESQISAVGLRFQHLGRPNRAEGFQPEVAGLGIGRLPQAHSLGPRRGRHSQRAIPRHRPVDIDAGLVVQNVVDPRQRALDRILVLAVIGVRGIAQPFGAGQAGEIEARGVGDEKLVAGRVEHQFGQTGVAIAIGEGIDHLQHGPPFGSLHPAGQIEFHIIFHRRRVETIGFPLMHELPAQIEHIDGGRQDRLDPRIDGGGQPGRPAALGAAQHQKVPDFLPPVGGEFLHGVHGADGGLGHRQMHRPFQVAGDERLIQAVGQDFILLAAPTRIFREKQRLVRHLPDGGDDRPSRDAGRSQQFGHRSGGRTPVAAAVDQQHGGFGAVQRHFRDEDDDLVFPDRPVYLAGGAPLLGGHPQEIGGVESPSALRVIESVGIVRVRPGDITIQGGFFGLDTVRQKQAQDGQP